ncbi:hypothetical protein NQ318_013335 [Aromia moschata]|uniref:Uncharacterized protein n=1 Tax=Aromia moschata TaxID=1265417 RepID=A0AAV8XVZ5_9CUCU|nr:hypothetical protein NQ318_013335 [Aromia moschata]
MVCSVVWQSERLLLSSTLEIVMSEFFLQNGSVAARHVTRWIVTCPRGGSLRGVLLHGAVHDGHVGLLAGRPRPLSLLRHHAVLLAAGVLLVLLVGLVVLHVAAAAVALRIPVAPVEGVRGPRRRRHRGAGVHGTWIRPCKHIHTHVRGYNPISNHVDSQYACAGQFTGKRSENRSDYQMTLRNFSENSVLLV